jgi:nitrite reductase (NADH) small subunit
MIRLGSIDLIPPGEGRTFQVAERTVAVFHTRTGAVYATQAECPHRKGPLADGMLGGDTLVCPLHGYQYDLATGSPRGHTCAALATFPVEVTSGGELWLKGV